MRGRNDELASLVVDVATGVLGADGLALLAELQARRVELVSRWTESVGMLEAFATLAEATGEVSTAAAIIEEKLPTLDAALAPAAHTALGHLLALGASRQRASAALGAAEAHGTTAGLRAGIARDRGLVASSERLWPRAERELRDAIEMFRACGNSLGAAEATVYLARTIGAQGKSAEAIDLILRQLDETPSGGLLELRTVLLLGRLHLDRLDLERADDLHAQAQQILSHELFDANFHLSTLQAEAAWWREDWDLARQCGQAARASSAAKARPLFAAYAEYTLALIEFDAGDFERSLLEARSARALAAALDLPGVVAGALQVEVCALAALGRREDALVGYRSLRPPNTQGGEARYHQGMAAVAELLLGQLATSADDAAAYAADAEANIAALVVRNELGTRWIDATLAMRILARRVSRYASPELLTKLFRRPRAVEVDPAGLFIVLDNDERVSIAHRPVLQRVLVRLSREAEARPGEPVSFSQLVDAAWPGDRATESSLRARLRVAVSTLRQLALDDALKTHEGGYSLQFPDSRAAC